ncbi:MAG: hypothetical protein JO254_06100 [Pseudolabrys sp.]|nr:hypothetical protein [Pseudolabrys sp.]
MTLTMRRLMAAGFAGLFVSAFSAGAIAETRWQRDHPRRTEVNRRLDRQDARINRERREGEISGAQARALHREDRQIRREERSMARTNGGYITRGEQRALNRQENAVSRQIGR